MLCVIQDSRGHCYLVHSHPPSLSVTLEMQLASSSSGHFSLVSSADIPYPFVPSDRQEQTPALFLSQTPATSILSALSHPSVAPQGLETSQLLFGDHTGVLGFCEAVPKPTCHGTSFTWLIHNRVALLCTVNLYQQRMCKSLLFSS